MDVDSWRDDACSMVPDIIVRACRYLYIAVMTTKRNIRALERWNSLYCLSQWRAAFYDCIYAILVHTCSSTPSHRA